MEILDPSLESSFFADIELLAKAELMVKSSMVDDLKPDKFTEYVCNNVDDKLEYVDLSALHNEFYLETTANYCIAEIMDDQRARSEFHIAGEICRLTLALQIVAQENCIDVFLPNPDISSLHNMSRGTGGVWIPNGTATVCPTIDGLRPGADSINSVWLKIIQEELKEYAVEDIFTMIEPPFLLNSGNIVAESRPIYYGEKTESRFEDDAPLRRSPSDLVLV